jgi:hypothetical protein
MYAIDYPDCSHQHFRRSVQLAAVEDVLPDREVVAVCRELGYAWRNRQLPPGPMVRSMVYRGLNSDRSIAAAVADLAALNGGAKPPSDSAWCQARDRMPEAVLLELHARLTMRMRRTFGRRFCYRDRPVFIVDGTGVSMPDTPELAGTFGYTRSKQYASRFPVARVTVIGIAGLNAIFDYRIDDWRCCEDEQFHDMWQAIPTGAICLFDRYFSSFYNLAKLRQRRIAVVSRLHHRRDPKRLIRQGRPIGPHQWLVPFELAGQLRRRYDDATLPRRLWVRLIEMTFGRNGRQHRQWLVTTLTDPARYPRRDIVALYRQRWQIETRLGEIKTVLSADVLRSKTPHALRCEIGAILLGHTMVWCLIHQATESSSVDPGDVSFATAVKTVLAFSHELAHAHGQHRRQLQTAMLEHIAANTNHHPFGRSEPRLIRRDPVRYGILRTTRAEARKSGLT